MNYANWLETNNLIAIAKENAGCFKKILRNCLNAKDEEVLILSDYGFEKKRIAPLMASAYYLAAKEMDLKPRLILQEPRIKGEEASKEITNAMLDLRKENIILVCMSQRMGKLSKELGNSYRTFAIEQKHRWLSTLKLGELDTGQFSNIIDAVDIDYAKLQQTASQLKARLDNGSEIHITTDAGTDLYISIKGKKAKCNDGNYKKPGTGGNIPVGEVYIPPKWKKVEGKVVIDASSSYRFGTQLIKEPIEMTIKKGEVVNIDGGKEAKNLQGTLDWAEKRAKYPWGIRRIGELGIGINPKAKIVGATTIDEKTLGTAHIALGSNYWFGGTIYAMIHLDQVFKNPEILIDGEVLKIWQP